MPASLVARIEQGQRALRRIGRIERLGKARPLARRLIGEPRLLALGILSRGERRLGNRGSLIDISAQQSIAGNRLQSYRAVLSVSKKVRSILWVCLRIVREGEFQKISRIGTKSWWT